MFLSGFTTKRNTLETEYMEITHVIAGSKMDLFFTLDARRLECVIKYLKLFNLELFHWKEILQHFDNDKKKIHHGH